MSVATYPRITATTEAPPSSARSTRLVSIDLLRGYFVLILAAIHLDYVPSVLGYFDGRGALFVSEAEGFFLISGLLVGMMRRRDLEQVGLSLAIRRSWSRAFRLYAIACGLTIAYTAIGRVAADQHWVGAKGDLDNTSSWTSVLVNTLNLHYVYGWADFITFYAPLFVLAPFVVWLMAHRLTWLVVLASVGSYVSLSFALPVWGHYGAIVQWQVYFMVGAAIGYHFTALTARVRGLSATALRRLSYGALIAAATVYGFGMLLLFRPSAKPSAHWFDVLMFNNRLGTLRPLFALIMFAAGLVVLNALQRQIMAAIGPVLILFGRNSLYVYLLQSVIIFAIPFFLRPGGLVANTVMDAAVIGLVWLALRTQFLFNIIPR